MLAAAASRRAVAPDLGLSDESMGMMVSGYGSECHLLRYLGRHRTLLDRHVLEMIGGAAIEWLDHPFDRTRSWPDGEWQGLDFLNDDAPAKAVWRITWPQRGKAPNWDAIGRLRSEAGDAWLLVEAKANVEELRSSCQACPYGGQPLIETFLARTKERLGVAPDRDWLDAYYQLCNRLAVLDLLNEHGSPAHLLYIYFVGDRSGPRRTCPRDAAGWEPALRAMQEHLGLPSAHPLARRVHKLFLPVCGEAEVHAQESFDGSGTKEITAGREAATAQRVGCGRGRQRQ